MTQVPELVGKWTGLLRLAKKCTTAESVLLAHCSGWIHEPVAHCVREFVVFGLCARPFRPNLLAAVLGSQKGVIPADDLTEQLTPASRIKAANFIIASDPGTDILNASNMLRALLATVPKDLINAEGVIESQIEWMCKSSSRIWALRTMRELGLDVHLAPALIILDASKNEKTSLRYDSALAAADGLPLLCFPRATVLCLAAQEYLSERLDIAWVTNLIEAGVPINALSGENAESIAHHVVKYGVKFELIASAHKCLTAAGVDWTLRSKLGQAAAHHAAKCLTLGWWTALADVDAGWTSTDALGFTPFDALSLNEDLQFEKLVKFLATNSAELLREISLGHEKLSAQTLLEKGLVFWLEGLPTQAQEKFRDTAAAHFKQQPECGAAHQQLEDGASASSRPEGTATWALYSNEAWQKMLTETDQGDGNKALKGVIKRQTALGDDHRIRPLAMVSLLTDGLPLLRESFPHFGEVIDHIHDECRLQMLGDKSFWLSPMLLVGGPGVGKTFFFEQVAALVETSYRILNMEGVTASWVITGSSNQWSDGRPGCVFETLETGKTANPIILLDEMDKVTGGNYPPGQVVLPLLEPTTAKVFRDECAMLPIDARRVVWVATANEIARIPAPLLSRMNVFYVAAPNSVERKALVRGVYKSVLANNEWGRHMAPTLCDSTVQMASELQGSGATRDLRRGLSTACSKAVAAGRFDVQPCDLPPARLPARRSPWDAPMQLMTGTAT